MTHKLTGKAVARSLPNTPRRAVLLGSLALVAAAAAPAAQDPMRPLTPPAAAAPSAPGGPDPRLTTGRPPGSTAPARPPARVAAVRQDTQQQWTALVGERWMRVGDKLPGGQTVVAIGLHGVDLQDAATRRRQVLHLLPPLAPAEPAEPASAAAQDTAASAPRRRTR